MIDYTIKKPLECIQCAKPMEKHYGNKDWTAPFCDEPECPLYGVLQIGIQDMGKVVK